LLTAEVKQPNQRTEEVKAFMSEN